jgi:alanyl-tRNA synthetase
MTSQEIRRQFIDFFVQKHGHTFVPSSPVVPHDDPTLLFTNAGMNQFKPYFLGVTKPPYPRAANTQKCIRAGGKHNDLDDVGRSRRHHTFFEMLGNWSFGDYFKRGAIEMAWELLTKVWGLDPTRLHVSCFEGDAAHGVPRDDEAAKIWKEVAHLPDDHIHYFGKDNFWEMGETGPCGPCTEIYVDRTPDKTGGPQVNGTDPRVMEIWNLVFIQYNRDASGHLTTLPSQHVDTGMGLERICQVLQGKDDNYATDLFTPIFDAISKISGLKYSGQFPATNAADPVAEAGNPQLRHDIAFRVIADHVRCLTFALTDGAVPSNEGRGYVLRRILRRAVRFGRQQLNLRDPFIHTLVPVVVETMGDMFPELKKNPQHVIDVIKDEEVSFGKTIDRGITLFEDATRSAEVASKIVKDEKTGVSAELVISAEDAFKLHDTYGFPIDLTRIMAEERGMKVDVAGYEILMEKAKELARLGGKAGASAVLDLPPNILAELETLHIHPTDDHFKFERGAIRATVRAIWNGANLDQSADASATRPGEQIAVILDKTNFYAEMGGQIGDSGEIRTVGHAIFVVETTRVVAGFVLHVGHIKHGKVDVGDSVEADVWGGRDRIQQNHTATHLANWALREVLGDHVQQKGSLVDDEKLRFDFVHQKALAEDELGRVETLVAERIARQWPVDTQIAPQEHALKIHGLRAVFGEKYPPMVRVVSIGAKVADLLADPTNPQWRQYSVEFCGGTHLANTTEAGGFVITAEDSVSKGIRRIVALTGNAAKEAAAQTEVIASLLDQAEQTPEASLPGLIAALQKAVAVPGVGLRIKRKAQGAIAELQGKLKLWQKGQGVRGQAGGPGEAAGGEALLAGAQSVNGSVLIVASVPNASADTLRNTMDWLKKKHPQGNIALLLASAFSDMDKDGNVLPPKVNLLAAVGDPLIGKIKAGDWIKAIAPLVGGTGGGRPQLAMAGGRDVAKIDEALAAAREYAVGKLQ